MVAQTALGCRVPGGVCYGRAMCEAPRFRLVARADLSCICGDGGFEVRHSAEKWSLAGSSPHFSPNSFSYRGSDGVGNTGLGLMLAKLLKTADNFCAEARYFVHVTFATLRRFGRSHHFRQKNTYEFVRFTFKSCSKARLFHSCILYKYDSPQDRYSVYHVFSRISKKKKL